MPTFGGNEHGRIVEDVSRYYRLAQLVSAASLVKCTLWTWCIAMLLQGRGLIVFSDMSDPVPKTGKGQRIMEIGNE